MSSEVRSQKSEVRMQNAKCRLQNGRTSSFVVSGERLAVSEGGAAW